MIQITNFVKDQNSNMPPTEILDFHGIGNKSTVISTATILVYTVLFLGVVYSEHLSDVLT